MKYVIANNELTQGTSTSVSNYNVKHIQIYLQGKIENLNIPVSTGRSLLSSVLNHSTLEFRDFSKRAPGS